MEPTLDAALDAHLRRRRTGGPRRPAASVIDVAPRRRRPRASSPRQRLQRRAPMPRWSNARASTTSARCRRSATATGRSTARRSGCWARRFEECRNDATARRRRRHPLAELAAAHAHRSSCRRTAVRPIARPATRRRKRSSGSPARTSSDGRSRPRAPPGQKHIGVDGPLAGPLLANRVLADGATVPLDGNIMMVAEAEFAFKFARAPAEAREPLHAGRGARRRRVAASRDRGARLALQRFRAGRRAATDCRHRLRLLVRARRAAPLPTGARAISSRTRSRPIATASRWRPAAAPTCSAIPASRSRGSSTSCARTPTASPPASSSRPARASFRCRSSAATRFRADFGEFGTVDVEAWPDDSTTAVDEEIRPKTRRSRRTRTASFGVSSAFEVVVNELWWRFPDRTGSDPAASAAARRAGAASSSPGRGGRSRGSRRAAACARRPTPFPGRSTCRYLKHAIQLVGAPSEATNRRTFSSCDVHARAHASPRRETAAGSGQPVGEVPTHREYQFHSRRVGVHDGIAHRFEAACPDPSCTAPA